MRILQHFLPSQDLTLVNLRQIAQELGNDHEQTRVEDPKRGNAAPQNAKNENEEVADLHSQLGCLMEDSLGEYRENNPNILFKNEY